MQRNNVPHIRIAPVDNSSDRFIAAFTSEALNATFSVVFRENVSGAVKEGATIPTGLVCQYDT
jgi:hypothetical protein